MSPAPRKKGPRRCCVCTALILTSDEVVLLPHVGRVHEDCGQELERAIKDGGCNRSAYLQRFAEGMAA